MEPTLSDGDEVEVLQFDRPVERGDIIVFASPISPFEHDRQSGETYAVRIYAKRVIGLPDETLEIDPEAHEVIIDGVTLREPYIQGITTCGDSCVFEVPHKVKYAPSPSQGSEPLFYGESLSYDPCERTACYFVMGDNRQNSSDSRQGWFVPIQNIIGWVDVDSP